MNNFKPEKKALTVMRFIILFVSLILYILVRIYVPFEIAKTIFAVFLIIMDVFMMFVYLPIYFSSLNYDMNDEKIIKHSGVFFKSHQTVKYSTVQYSTVVTTPFSKHTGLNFVVLFVYGGSLRLVFLSEKDAMEVLRRCRDVS